LIPNQPTQQAGHRTRDPCHLAPKAHATRKPRELAHGREHEQDSEDHIEPPVARPTVKEGADQAARRTGQSEAPKDPAVHAARQQLVADRGADDMRDGHCGKPRINLKSGNRSQQTANAKPGHSRDAASEDRDHEDEPLSPHDAGSRGIAEIRAMRPPTMIHRRRATRTTRPTSWTSRARRMRHGPEPLAHENRPLPRRQRDGHDHQQRDRGKTR